jgi:hypothetical protein
MEALVDSLRDALGQAVAFLPALIGGLIVLFVGWLVALAVRSVVRAVLPRMGFDRFLARHRLTNRSPDAEPGSRPTASAAFWAVMLVALMQAANIWGLRPVANGLGQAIAYIPNLVAAVLIIGAAFVVGNWVYDRLRASGTEERFSSVILPGAVRAGILTIGAFLSLRQLLIAPEILVIAFTLVFGAIAVATALSFGLGGRRAAERMTEDWYDRQQQGRRRAEGSPMERRDAGISREPRGAH